jgi:prepilin-type N-terminal cleavage/methylation domain-containing protein
VNKTNKQSSAFTIVELLIVIVIIAILASIVVVGYKVVIANANDKTVQADITKLADAIKLKSLDNDALPIGGATSSNTGDSSNLPGVTFRPTVAAYDVTVSNFFYCEGTINGNDEFAVAARSKSGKAFSYLSSKGVSDFTGYTWSTANNGVALCTALGFSAPFTWSYGYNPTPNYGWFMWAYAGDLITNYATNPSAELAGGWYSNNGAIYPASRDTSQKRSGVQSVSSYNVGSSTALMSIYSPGSLDGNGIPITDPGVYTASAYFRADVASQGRIGLSTRTNGTWSGTTYGNNVTGTTNSWTQMSYTFTVPTGTDALRYVINVSAIATQPAGVKAYADDFILTKGSDTPNYADGNSPSWIWNGTVNGSTSTGPPK